MARIKARLGAKAQGRLVRWIDEALNGQNRSQFVRLMGITGFKQTTFDKCVGGSKPFTEQDAQEICRKIERDFLELVPPSTVVRDVPAALCTTHCQLFHALNAATCTDPEQALQRQLATNRVHGHYKLTLRFVRGNNRGYGVEFRKCSCGATLFDYVEDPDPRPLSSHGFAICVGDMMNIYMIGGGLHWTLSCNVPRQIHNTAMTGIFVDPNPVDAQIQGNKFVLVKKGTTIERELTDAMIATLLDNDASAANGTLVAARL
jgi:hypothetical protein